jgi:lipopolysaccharide/colanic/teichoic acid biosynthesis glycosyltransferase
LRAAAGTADPVPLLPTPVARADASVVHRVVVVGETQDIPAVLEHPALAFGARFEVVGIVPLDVLAMGFPANAIREQVRAHRADTILLAGAAGRRLMDALSELSITLGCRLLALLPTAVPAPLDPVIIWEGQFPFIELAVASTDRLRRLAKRALDVSVAALGLTLALPLVAVAALAIRLESAGSPFFGHQRVGRGGRRFFCWKLRTMSQDAEARLQVDAALMDAYQRNDFKLPDDRDPRVTRVGRLLRKSSIDEIPQLWNVLIGEMSLVGPRPLVPDELRHFQGHVLALLAARPGLTGAWAVSGRHSVGYPKRAEIELRYVRRLSIRQDLSILVRTVGAVINPGVGPTGSR